ncbi:VOC family protein [Gluconobacter morbifer]|uniref:VOC family protein n=1 Tax=Gluconobacter morbifer TaxID=479935 RepID=UPI0002FEEE2D|nr:VOC family protein [Gluconobacter morbifer]
MSSFPALNRPPIFKPGLRCALAALSFGLCLAAGPAPVQAATLPPLVTPPTHQTLPGKMVYAQLTTPDLNATKAFYGQLLGWTFEDVPVSHGHFVQAMVNGHAVAGLVEHPLPAGKSGAHPFWLPVISTPDAAALARSARSWGGQILLKPKSLSGRGEETIVSDPQGAIFAALHSESGDPVDSDAQTVQGQWIWNALLTSSPSPAAGFYQKLFGYQVQTAQEQPEALRYILSSQSWARATVNPLPARLPPTARARWMSFVQVDSVGATAEKAAQLGGKVLVEPHLDHQNSMIAIIADPSGAAFGIMEWHDPDTAGEAK